MSEHNGKKSSQPVSVKPSYQGEWSESAERVLRERYLKKDEHGKTIETPDEMCWRVARAIAAAEAANSGKSAKEIEAAAEEYAAIMLSRQFMPNSPTLMNAGKGNNLQLSACFVIPVEDSLSGIFESVKHAAIVHQSGGGTGFSFSRLRPEGSRVASTNGVASGPVSFMRIFDQATESVKQGGSRRGANMGILRVDHPDVEQFIDCKLSGGITNFNISVAITDAFMHALANNTTYDLIDPHTKKITKQKSAREIWNRIISAAWSSGDPGLVFIDRANHSTANPVPEVESLEATNPCGEQWLGPYDACNLGSINLGMFVQNGEIDWRHLEQVTRVSARFLDDVIDVNPYPLPQIHDKVHVNRRIGLGVMGWADMLFLLNIRYDSEKAIELAEKVMSNIRNWATDESQKMAAERGAFPNWSKSIYKNSDKLRNATRTTVAPTGTISIIADCSSGIEPIFALAFQHKVKQPDGSYRVLDFVNPIFLKLLHNSDIANKDEIIDYVKQHGTLHGHPSALHHDLLAFITAHEIAPEWHIRMQAAFQKGVDNSISKTINLPNSASEQDVEDAYMLAWNLGCLGITVFRDGCKSEQVLNTGIQKQETPQTDPQTSPVDLRYINGIKDRPEVVHGYTRQIRSPEGKVNVTLNSDEDGLLEVFVTIGKAGSDVSALAEALGRLASLNLRIESPVSQNERAYMIMEQLRSIGGSSSIGFGAERVRSLPDAVARALGIHIANSGNVGEPTNGTGAPTGQSKKNISAKVTGNLCPKCGCNTLVFEEGCKKCMSCGYSEC